MGWRSMLQALVPKSLEVKVAEIKNLDDYEQPLNVSFDVTGTLGTPTGKRLVMPVDLFTAGETATFPQEEARYGGVLPLSGVRAGRAAGELQDGIRGGGHADGGKVHRFPSGRCMT